MIKIAVIVARFDGEAPRKLPTQIIPAGCQIDYFYFDDSAITFNKEMSAQEKENYLKHKTKNIAGLKDYDVFIWLDKSVKVTSDQLISEIMKEMGHVAFLTNADNTILVAWNKELVSEPQLETFTQSQKIKEYQEKLLSNAGYSIIKTPRPIIGFWHICMINNWQEIVKEQLNELLQHGLYTECHSIQIGAIGSEENKKELERIIHKHYKLSIKYYSTDITEYEFPTLNLIKQECAVNEFYGFYFHTKGVSYNAQSGGKHWRHYMNYYNLELWQECVARLKQGNDLCGVKLLVNSPRNVNPTHYSGNFFHFRSEYVATCPEISTLNQNNRFEAEFWICKGNNPSMANLCDKFIDYNVKGDFVKPVTGRTVVHTLCFNLPSEVEVATKLLYEQNQNKYFEHVIIDIGFPLEKPNEIPEDIEKTKHNNSLFLYRLAKKMGSKYRKTNNVGVSQNWETVRKEMLIDQNDVLICADPDERPKHNNWVKAVSDVLMHGDKIAWCSLMYVDHIPVLEKYPHEVKYVYGHKIYLMNSLLGWAQGGFSGAFLKEIGGVPFHEKAPVYGWIEEVCYNKMQKLGWKWAIVADYQVEHTECSPLYRAWKTQITSHVNDGQMSFETWLKSQLDKNERNSN